MKKTILSLLLILCPMAILAQTDSANKYNSVPVKHFEGEVFIGFTTPLGECGVGDLIGPAFGYEFRYNIDEVPLDFSTQIHYTSAANNRTNSIAVFGDWNFGQGQIFNAFAGLGVGWAQHYSHNCDWYYDDDDSSKPICIPRVGVEMFRHIRFTLSSNISGRGFNNLQLSIGVVFGGGKKN